LPYPAQANPKEETGGGSGQVITGSIQQHRTDQRKPQANAGEHYRWAD